MTTAGGVKCWGQNAFLQLGHGTTTDSAVPVDVVGLQSGVVAVSAGSLHTCAVTSVGAVKCWGLNASGQLGDGTTTNSAVPVDVVGLSGVVAVSAGRYHSCALTSAGAVKCWGDNGNGQLGIGTFDTSPAVPVDVVGLGAGVTAITSGDSHSCAVTSVGAVVGAVKCWGYNVDGALGDGTTNRSAVPVDVVGLGSGVVAVSANQWYSCAVTSAGAAKCWGDNGNGQLGDGTTTSRLAPVDVAGLGSGVAKVSAGEFHSCAVTSAGAAKCWGGNGSGELGNGTGTSSALPVDVVGLGSGVTAVTAGGNHSCALTAGVVKCWGNNGSGQLGDGTGRYSNVPVNVDGR